MADKLVTALSQRIQGVVVGPDQIGDEDRTNFGRLFAWVPRLVVTPRHAEDLLEVVRFARENGLTVSTKGAAHSQSQIAISDGGILVDMKSMGRVLSMNKDAATVDVEGGAVWR